MLDYVVYQINSAMPILMLLVAAGAGWLSFKIASWLETKDNNWPDQWYNSGDGNRGKGPARPKTTRPKSGPSFGEPVWSEEEITDAIGRVVEVEEEEGVLV